MDNNNDKKPTFAEDFRRRISEVRPTRWIRFAVVSLIFFAWVAWLGNWWVSLWIILLFDVYITGYIPFTWWKQSKNKSVKSVMSWVDAIVYALILVYFVFAFVGQNYQIPSSSLEKTLLTGDYLWVNKMAYGPRVPMTPIHFPLVQNTLPIVNTKSYIETPQWEYHRLKGFGNVERGDIVVFNFPAGDTVALKAQNPDYYHLVEMYGRKVVNTNKDVFGDVIYRPVDRRENYVKRAVGLPGDNLKIMDGVIYINGEAVAQPENVQFNHFYQKADAPFTADEWDALGIAADDRRVVPVSPSDLESLKSLGFVVKDNGKVPTIYNSPLTPAMVEQLKAMPGVSVVMQEKPTVPEQLSLFPSGIADNWTRADYGELWIPKKGETIDLNAHNWKIYGRCIRNYEHNDAELRGDTVYIDGKPADSYTFKMDYYFMMGDNRDNSLDSRFWGFVPEDHIVGKPMFVIISFDKDKGLFDGGIRWNRVFKDANPDK